MKPILILAAALVIALSDQAFARLGQAEDQVNALFGKLALINAGIRFGDAVTF